HGTASLNLAVAAVPVDQPVDHAPPLEREGVSLPLQPVDPLPLGRQGSPQRVRAADVEAKGAAVRAAFADSALSAREPARHAVDAVPAEEERLAGPFDRVVA